VAAVALIVPRIVLAGQLVSALAGVLTIIPGALIARRVAGERAALWTAWLLAALPLGCQYSARPQTEALYGLLFALGLLSGVRLLSEGKIRDAIGLGVAAGLAAATRPEGAGLLVAGGIICLATRRLRALPALVLPFVILYSPVVLMTHDLTGRWTLSSKAGYIYQRNLQKDPDAYYFRLTPDGRRLMFEDYILDPEREQRIEWGRLGEVYLVSLGRHLWNFFRCLDPPLLILATLGWALVPRPRWTSEGRFLALLLLGYTIALPVFSSERRFWIALLPIPVILAARGVESLPERWRVRVVVITMLLLLPHAATPVWKQGFAWQDSPERRLAAHLPRDRPVKILSRDGRVAIFAGADHIFLPVGTAEEILRFAENRGAEYIAVRRRDLLESLMPHVRVIAEDEGRMLLGIGTK
jgi:hypothetical protein